MTHFAHSPGGICTRENAPSLDTFLKAKMKCLYSNR